ncbi:MAG: hypothetical protein QNJ72_14935 [Pleurocapsa sp. MO_226.B13]|nr:hypothetical protein [Pleurocapsa sp. MO_226.B13]
MPIKDLQELDILTQDYIDLVGWRGTLIEIYFCIEPQSPNTESAIALYDAINSIEPDLSLKEAIAEYGLEEIFKSLLKNSQAEMTSRPCPEEVRRLLRKLT